jgi:hypothetical protein
MRCEWCESEADLLKPGGGLRYCSVECEHRAVEYAILVWEARVGDDEPPSKEEFMARNQRARKWTPDEMKERIDELREGIA